jgi:hypothetical protein
MKSSNLLKMTLSFILLFSISVVKGQVEYRVGLGLYEMTEVYTGDGTGHPHPWVYSHQALSSMLLERQNKRITHRITARYVNLNHTLRNQGFQPYPKSEKGEFKRSGFDFGYSYLFSYGKHKRFSTGVGVSYVQNKMQSPTFNNELVDLKSDALTASFTLEMNFKFLSSWYASPSIQFFVPIYSNSVNRAPETSIHYNLETTLQITPIKISIKKTIASRG